MAVFFKSRAIKSLPRKDHNKHEIQTNSAVKKEMLHLVFSLNSDRLCAVSLYGKVMGGETFGRSVDLYVYHVHSIHMEKRVTNQLEKHRRNNRKTQAEVAKFIGITQSQYSRLENAECSQEPYLAKLAECFNCKENELHTENILVELENDFLNDGFKQVGGTYHEKKSDKVYLNIKGWFPNHIGQEVIDYLTEHMEAEVKKKQMIKQEFT